MSKRNWFKIKYGNKTIGKTYAKNKTEALRRGKSRIEVKKK